jgi:hypothetical protein
LCYIRMPFGVFIVNGGELAGYIARFRLHLRLSMMGVPVPRAGDAVNQPCTLHDVSRHSGRGSSVWLSWTNVAASVR